MRAWEASALRAPAVLLLLVALALPALAASPPACVPSCDVPSTEAGYAPPVLVVANGTTVTWSGVPVESTTHTATESGVALSAACLNVAYVPSAGSATFAIHDGALWVRQPLKLERRCMGAQEQPDGSFLLQYHCLYHAAMQGVLVVRPQVTP